MVANHTKNLSGRESLTVNIMKGISVLSVIAAHVVSYSTADIPSNIISSFWILFGKVGVIIFFVIGGFFYSRKPNDNKSFWGKKMTRIILPWFLCASVTYCVSAVLSHNLSFTGYIKWVFGSGTWYYYITMYTCFLLLFKWFYTNDIVLYCLIGIQIISLTLISFGISTTPPLPFLTDYLNPLHWIGYFSLGILIRRHRLDCFLREHRVLVIAAYLIAAASFGFLYFKEIHTYFHIISSVFSLSSLVIIADLAYRVSVTRIAKMIGQIGICSYCIYLLHMQIVQAIVSRIPHSIFTLAFSPFIGLFVMLACISVGFFICGKLPFGKTILALVGLPNKSNNTAKTQITSTNKQSDL